MAYVEVAYGIYTWTIGKREAFVLLNEERKLHQLSATCPHPLTSHKELRVGDRRSTCPLGTNGERHQDIQHGPVSTSPLYGPVTFRSSAVSIAERSVSVRRIPLITYNPVASTPALVRRVLRWRRTPARCRHYNTSASSQRNSVKTPALAPTTTAAFNHPATEASTAHMFHNISLHLPQKTDTAPSTSTP
ncbi:hypothetical protein LAZ67_9001858 [Cordylochernes scorpioides]|uniref:Uncharacterized protein n=1 Tax=Cordylochernes scorpioides TaxID=51811 RepID=A0ABY6KV11_9ARAC|nr:hypothetical protein LAZ67_9001858 [Cordylochernes scorpioides]